MPALTFAVELLALLPKLIAAGRDVTALISEGHTALTAMQAEKRDPSAEEWSALNKHIDALQAELHATD